MEPDIKVILSRYEPEPFNLLPVLQDVQEQEHYVSKESMQMVAKYLQIPESRVFSVATFYSSLSLVPLGKYVIRVCNGTACHLRGSPAIIGMLERELEITNGETTNDGMFTLKTVNCLGACAMAPVIMVNDRVFGNVKPVDIPKILAEVLES